MGNAKSTKPKITGEGRMPGDPTRDQIIESMIRVDHAGEFGAQRIYEGQLAVLGRSAAFLLPSAPCRSVAGGARAGLSAPRMDMQVRTPGKLEQPTQPAVHVPPSAPSHER